MRIIAGKYKGYVLKQPRLEPTRPTTNIAKEALFSIIDNYFNFDNIRFLDLFGGTGSITYEFASRGCNDITTVELHQQAIQFIRQTSEKLKMEGHRVLQMDVFEFINNTNEQFDIIFAGPPYKMPFLDTLPDVILQNQIIEGQGWFILEHDPKYNFDDHPHLWRRKNYGQTNFSIFVNEIQQHDA
jgi:16S rRNA (guanine(966)-N(2))-methyltransferase RsmD